MFGNLMNFMRQNIDLSREKLAQETIEAENDRVKVVVTGLGQVQSIGIKVWCNDADDIALLEQDLVSATNQAISAARKAEACTVGEAVGLGWMLNDEPDDDADQTNGEDGETATDSQ